MYLMYTLNENGDRVYTLKVSKVKKYTKMMSQKNECELVKPKIFFPKN